MEYRIVINCDNAAFEDYPNDEIIRILKTIIDSNLKRNNLFDINGNKVGFADFYE